MVLCSETIFGSANTDKTLSSLTGSPVKTNVPSGRFPLSNTLSLSRLISSTLSNLTLDNRKSSLNSSKRFKSVFKKGKRLNIKKGFFLKLSTISITGLSGFKSLRSKNPSTGTARKFVIVFTNNLWPPSCFWDSPSSYTDRSCQDPNPKGTSRKVSSGIFTIATFDSLFQELNKL